jgi:septum formation protein
MRLILASASPRRADLLRAGGFTFDVVTSDIDERLLSGESARAYVRRLASEKSAAVRAKVLAGAATSSRDSAQTGGAGPLGQGGGLIVLAADTAVVVDEEVFGKPTDTKDWRRMLACLSGRRHEVLTGLSLRRDDHEITAVESTAVFFSPLEPSEIDEYLQSGEGLDKAGGYAVQGQGARFVHRIEGSYSNVVGLPVSTVYQWLRKRTHS